MGGTRQVEPRASWRNLVYGKPKDERARAARASSHNDDHHAKGAGAPRRRPDSPGPGGTQRAHAARPEQEQKQSKDGTYLVPSFELSCPSHASVCKRRSGASVPFSGRSAAVGGACGLACFKDFLIRICARKRRRAGPSVSMDV